LNALQALEEVKVREVAIVELQKRISEGEGRLKQQQVRAPPVAHTRGQMQATDGPLLSLVVGRLHVA
jgi:hypothetical protein